MRSTKLMVKNKFNKEKGSESAALVQKNFNGLKDNVENSFKYFLAAMFPYHFGDVAPECSVCANLNLNNNNNLIEKFAMQKAAINLEQALCRVMDDNLKADSVTQSLLDKLPEILRVLMTDVQAAYEGDPAAKSYDEVILSYPAFIAISAYRIAHELFIMQVPLVPRIMTEHAHKLTGIDIHPGAAIGEYFFIDHGTGVVIGETSTIGCHVKLYQNVTIGAKSFQTAPDGTLVKGIKRHPDIGNNVVIYAGATILGGDTFIGDDSVIGGNVWLTHSVKAGSVILNKTPASLAEFEDKIN